MIGGIKKLLFRVGDVFTKHQTFVVISVLLFLSTGVLVRIMQLSSTEPSQETIDNKVRTVKPVSFNEDAIEKIETLRESNVQEPGVNVQNNRNNPFSE